MRRVPTGALVVLALAALLAALLLVTWRQSRALEALAELEAARTERVLAEAQKEELERRIQYLESRSRVVRDAGERLGMRKPAASEIVYLQGGGR